MFGTPHLDEGEKGGIWSVRETIPKMALATTCMGVDPYFRQECSRKYVIRIDVRQGYQTPKGLEKLQGRSSEWILPHHMWFEGHSFSFLRTHKTRSMQTDQAEQMYYSETLAQ